MDDRLKSYAEALYLQSLQESAQLLAEGRANYLHRIAARMQGPDIALSGPDIQSFMRLYAQHVERCMDAKFQSYRKAFDEADSVPADQDFAEILAEMREVQKTQIGHAAHSLQQFMRSRGVDYKITESLAQSCGHGHDRVLQKWKVWRSGADLKKSTHTDIRRLAPVVAEGASPPREVLDYEAVGQIRKITDRFVRLGQGTPIHDAKANLGPKRHGLTQAQGQKFIREWSGSYFPCFRAAEFEDAPTRNYIWACTTLVIKALKALYRAEGARQYNGSEIRDVAAQQIDPKADADMVRTGLLFAVDFRRFWTTCGGSEGWPIGSIGVTEDILDFQSLDSAWSEELNSRLEVEKRDAEPASPAGALRPPMIQKEKSTGSQRKQEAANKPPRNRRGEHLRKQALHPRLLEHGFASFLRGSYDTAVFEAFKEVEVAVRAAAGLPQELIGTDLMRKAFNPSGGPLTRVGAHRSEEQALSDLFAGSIGWVKNPRSHRNVELRPKEAAELITLASYLLRVVDTRSKKQEAP